MQIVIKLSDEQYKAVQRNAGWVGNDLYHAVKNGTPLPKGNGRLTDLDKLINFTYNTYGINSGKCITKDNEDIIDYIYNKAETIIEADRSEEDANSD